jgi:chromosome segregation ATPase
MKVFFQRQQIFLLLLLTVLMMLPNDLYARSRGRNRNSGAAAAAAKRKQMIASIQTQIAEAKKVLAMAESQVQLSQSEVNAAVGKLQGVSSQLNSMNTEHDAQLRALHELEKKLLDGVPEGSPLDNADDLLEQKLEELDEAFHLATGIHQHQEPVSSAIRAQENRNLTSNQKTELSLNPGYQTALQEVKDAVSNLEKCKREVLSSDSEWSRLHTAYVESSKELRSTKSNSQGTGLESLKAHQGLNKSKQLADAAKIFIAQGELKIRQLGGSPSPAPKAPKSSSK